GELEAEDEIEELDAIFQGEAAAIVEVRRAVLNAAQGESLDGTVGRLMGEALDVKVVVLVIEIGGRDMARGALRLAEEEIFAADFLLAGFAAIQAAGEWIELGR